MFGNRNGQHESYHRNYHKATILAAVLLLSILSIGAVAGFSAREAQAQAPRQFALDSPVATITGVNLREQPAADGASLTSMPVNARAIVIGGPFNDGWYWLDYNDLRGYTNGKYLVQVDENYTPIPLETPTPLPTDTPVPVFTDTPATTTTVVNTPASVGTPIATQPGASTPAATATPDYTAPTTPGDYTGLWLGELTYGGNVRSGPGLDQKIIKGWWAGRRVLLYQAVTDSKGGVWYRVSEPPEAPMYVHSSLIRRVEPVQFEPARYKGRWVSVNLAQQIVTAYQGGTPVMVTLASTGKAKHETTPGVWKIYWRLPKQEMKNGNLASPDYYDLKDVPWVQYFHISGEALHGTYWHDDFGHPHSHGCVNLSTPIAGWFYGWANVGTIVYVH